ncbi:MAG: DUF1015 domain-containing protein [Methanoculleaceae archaeon]
MVAIFSFRALHPDKENANRIASVPYDVVSAAEAREIIGEEPLSFLRVIRSDALTPDCDPDDDRVYIRARENLLSLEETGAMVRDPEPGLYLYRVKQGGNVFDGLVACVQCDDYRSGIIRRHEQTRYDKEEDRTRHIDVTNANTGLVFLLYRDPADIAECIAGAARDLDPIARVDRGEGGIHEVYHIDRPEIVDGIISRFRDVDRLYIADGHHRAKSAVNVADRRMRSGRTTPGSERFMAVLFPHNRVRIHGYSRLVRGFGDLNGVEFLERLSDRFHVIPYGGIDGESFQITPKNPPGPDRHTFHLYLDGRWYEVCAPRLRGGSITGSLDVTLLQRDVLQGILGIGDPRGDPRLQYLGGARPLRDLEEMVDSGEFDLAFAMQPIPVETVLDIAENGEVMPPKSTWFEPKLLSGLIVHILDE